MAILHQRQPTHSSVKPLDTSAGPSLFSHLRSLSIFNATTVIALLSLVVVLGVLFPWIGWPTTSFSGGGRSPLKWSVGWPTTSFSSTGRSRLKWSEYTLAQAVEAVAKNGTVIVCAVSQPYMALLNNWLISVIKQKRQEQVLIIAEDYATLYKVNDKWPGHAVLIPPAPDLQTAHKFGSQGFFNFTSRRPRHLLQILELGYQVMYNDVDMVWLADPFPFFEGNHDIYFSDDMSTVKPLNHSHALPTPGKSGRTYICSCMIFMRPTPGAKLVLKQWIREIQGRPWSRTKKSNDQPAFNWALIKIASQVNLYLLPQYAFPSGGLYFKNATWRKETEGKHVIIHNNYIIGFQKKIERFRDFHLWLVADYAHESPFSDIKR